MKIWILAKKEKFDDYENKRFVEVAQQMGIDLILVSPTEFDIIVTKEGKKSILYHGDVVELPDCLIPRMGAGTTYAGLAVIRHLERLGVFVLSSDRSIEISKDKLASFQFLSVANLPIPKTMLARFPLPVTVIDREFTYPIIIKTVSGSLGKGVFLCESKSQLEDLFELMEISKDPKVDLILQEFISSSVGKDIRVFVVGGRAIGAMLRTAKEGKFKANFSAGGNVTNFELNPAIEWLAIESARVMGLEIAGVDLLFDGDSYKVCEVNSSPGFQGFEQATNIDVPTEFFNYIQVRLEGHIF